MLLTTVCAVLFFICGNSLADDELIQNFSYTVSLQYNGTHNCSGALIRANRVLTTAHCIYPFRNNASALSIRVGSSNNTSGGEIVQVSRIIPHSQFKNGSVQYDIAVLHLESDVSSSTASPVRLVENNTLIPFHALANLTGWESPLLQNFLRNTLQVVEVPFVDYTECQSFFRSVRITDKQFCAGYIIGVEDACLDDSGDPLVYIGRLFGVSSFGWGCIKPNVPTVYTNVGNPTIRQFINSNL